MKFKYLTIFIGVLAFASLADAPRVFAAVVYEQNTQSTFTNLSGCTFTNIGSFIADATYNLTNQSQAQFYGKKPSDGLEISLYLSSTSNTGGLLSNFLFNFSDTGSYDIGNYTGTSTLTLGNTYYFFAFSCNGTVGDFGTDGLNPTGIIYEAEVEEEPTDTTTRFISVLPETGTTVSTTTSVGADLYANPNDFGNSAGRLKIKFSQDQSFACANAINVLDAFTCTGDNAYVQPFTVTFDDPVDELITGLYDIYQNVEFPAAGKWTAKFTIEREVSPWYTFGVFSFYKDFISTTTNFTVGFLTQMDQIQTEIASNTQALRAETTFGITSILASTTASIKSACTPSLWGSSFSIADCLTLLVYPGQQAMEDNFAILRGTPPISYPFRFIDILNDTNATTSLPEFSYTFGSTSPFYDDIGTIAFSPFASLLEADSIVKTAVSDQEEQLTVWQIMEPVVFTIVYLMLAFMIINDLTGIHRHSINSEGGVGNKPYGPRKP